MTTHRLKWFYVLRPGGRATGHDHSWRDEMRGVLWESVRW